MDEDIKEILKKPEKPFKFQPDRTPSVVYHAPSSYQNYTQQQAQQHAQNQAQNQAQQQVEQQVEQQVQAEKSWLAYGLMIGGPIIVMGAVSACCSQCCRAKAPETQQPQTYYEPQMTYKVDPQFTYTFENQQQQQQQQQQPYGQQQQQQPRHNMNFAAPITLKLL